MQALKKLLIIFAIVTGLILLLFNDNIRGYYRFKAICEKEGGLRVYQKLEPGVGLLAESYGYAQVAATIKGVGFVRFVELDGNAYDVRYLKGNPSFDTSFDKESADLSKPVLYGWKFVNGPVPNELRLWRSGVEITNLHTGQLAVRMYRYGYSKFNRDRTLLAAPSGEICASYELQTPEVEAQLFKH